MRDIAFLKLKNNINPVVESPTHVIYAELQGHFVEHSGYALYDVVSQPGSSGTPLVKEEDVIGMHIGTFNGQGIAILFNSDGPLPADVAYGVQHQFFCGADCTFEKCVKVGGFKECASATDPVCVAARDTHCALLALLDQLTTELNNLLVTLFGKQSEKDDWQAIVDTTQASVTTKTDQVNTLNSSISTVTTQVNNTQTSINQTAASITSVNNQINTTITNQNTTSATITAKKVIKNDNISTLDGLNGSIATVNGEITFNTDTIAELDVVKASEEATKAAREVTFAQDEVIGTGLIDKIKDLKVASIGVIGGSLPEILYGASEYISGKNQGVADYLKAGTDLIVKINHDLATNPPTLNSVTDSINQTGSGYEELMDNFIDAALEARAILTDHAKDVPLLGPLEERITKELIGEGILRSDKDFWEAMISENSEAAKLSDWLAQADRKTQTWFAERDEAMQEYLADRDEAFRDWIDSNGGWPENVETFGNKFSENFKEGNAKISIFYKDSGKELSEGSKALQAELEFLLSSCSKDLTTYFKEFKILAGGQSTDIEGLLNSERPDWETYPAAKLAFVTSIGSWLTRFTERCIFSSKIPSPNFKQPIGPRWTEETDSKPRLIEMIARVKSKLHQNIEDFGVDGVKSFDDQGEFIFPIKREFPGLCADLITEKGTLSYHKTTHPEFQIAATKHISEKFNISPELCNVGDGIKFTGMLYSVDPMDSYRNGILSSFDDDGRPHRSRYHRDVYHTKGKMGGAYSKDMTVGLNFYLQSSGDIVLANKLNNFLVANDNYICDILPPGHPALAIGTIEVPIGHHEQYGNCILTPPVVNNLERVRKYIGAESGEQNWLKFLIDEEIMKRNAGLPPSEKYEEMRSIVQLWFYGYLTYQITDVWMYGLETKDLDFPTHLGAATILLFSNMNMLTQGLADAAESIDKRWHADAQSKDFQIENLFYRFLANYTNSGDQAEYERIAQKLIKKMECWEFFLVDGDVPQECWPVLERNIPQKYYVLANGELRDTADETTSQIPFRHFDWRQGWAWQRAPKSGDFSDKYFKPQVATPFGHDLIFLAQLMLSEGK